MVEKSRHSVGGASRGDYAQDVRYIAREHMEVRRDCSRIAQCLKFAARRASHMYLLHAPRTCTSYTRLAHVPPTRAYQKAPVQCMGLPRNLLTTYSSFE